MDNKRKIILNEKVGVVHRYFDALIGIRLRIRSAVTKKVNVVDIKVKVWKHNNGFDTPTELFVCPSFSLIMIKFSFPLLFWIDVRQMIVKPQEYVGKSKDTRCVFFCEDIVDRDSLS